MRLPRDVSGDRLAEVLGSLIMGQGALPIIRDGEIIGACGVGGGTSEEDEECARAGIAQI